MNGSVVRGCAVWLATTAAAITVIWWAAADLTGQVTGPASVQTFDRLLTVVAEAALAGCASWAWLVTTTVLVEAAWGARRGRAARLPGIPPWARRPVLAVCGLAVVGVTTPAAATPGQVEVDGDGDRPDVIAGLPLPDRAAGPARPREPGQPGAAPTVTVVRSGDSLWSITEARLGADASVDDVAAGVADLYRRNRAVVGDDPDLILPGQRLLLPQVPGATDQPDQSRPDQAR